MCTVSWMFGCLHTQCLSRVPPLEVLFYTKQIKADLLWLFHANKVGTSVNINAKCWFVDVLRLKFFVSLKQVDEKVFGSFRKSSNATVKKIQI